MRIIFLDQLHSTWIFRKKWQLWILKRSNYVSNLIFEIAQIIHVSTGSNIAEVYQIAHSCSIQYEYYNLQHLPLLLILWVEL